MSDVSEFTLITSSLLLDKSWQWPPHWEPAKVTAQLAADTSPFALACHCASKGPMHWRHHIVGSHSARPFIPEAFHKSACAGDGQLCPGWHVVGLRHMLAVRKKSGSNDAEVS